MLIRPYETRDWEAIQAIHDEARKIELRLAGLDAAFLPLSIAAEREDLFDYPGLYVAELENGEVAGFTACDEEELAWLYVAPAHMRRGIGRALSLHAMQQFPGICEIEALRGNEPARLLYEGLGFRVKEIVRGKMPGNEDFAVEVYAMEKADPTEEEQP